MVDREREQLLGFLLGALEEPEQESVEKQLERNPKLLQDLATVRESLQPLWVAQPDFDPPAGLAARTCEFVASHPHPGAAASPEPAREEAPTVVPSAKRIPVVADEGEPRSWSWLDMGVAAGIVAAMLVLVFPAIQTGNLANYQ